ncbi:RIPOR family member 3 isoform X3 [Pseudoliparis swirei]|uniref:RIPOR family member 3 isoform X3 n=1 Tax=Pseudoliparis swirei TaxID=2059687 RepID=UPI0024BD943A|nr:RIPOR family member 3 isoform X3 [Pseudoliparis swirei]
MSVKLRFGSPSDGCLVHRRRSFTGFSSLTGRRRPSSGRNTTGGKSPRMHLSLSGGGGATWSLQPEEVDRVFTALHRGLKAQSDEWMMSYREQLQGLQAEINFLSSQQRETKRNSRLAFLYDLEKVCVSQVCVCVCVCVQVEELHESFLVQWRLLLGAVNMQRAFSLSPSSRASRDSLVELSRNYRHSLQEMSVMEEELETMLGELHVKMKGLVGFARLCLGDQYEVVMRLGRQRWRTRGRIQSDDTQTWDEEEKVFLPHIHHHFEIKVAEAKALGWLLVGMVTCASADFLVAGSQMMEVEVTELGTMKLQLEVTWSPFDRLRSTSRKTSGYSWTAPSTPNFMQHGDGSLVRARPIRGGVSLVNFLSNQPHPQSPFSPTQMSLLDVSTEEEERGRSEEEEEQEEQRRSGAPSPAAPRAPDLLRRSPAQAPPRVQDSPPAPPTLPPVLSPASPAAPPPSAARRRALAARLGALMEELEEALKEQSGSEAELRVLEQQVLHLATVLKNDLSLLSGSSSEEDDVEEVLGSFDFLSHDDDTSCPGSARRAGSGPLRRLGPSTSEDCLGVAPLTSGSWSLDQTLETHLDICCILLQAIGATAFRPTRAELLQETRLQADVLQRISCLLLENHSVTSAADVLPEAQQEVQLLWDQCCAGGAPFGCDSTRFCRTMKNRFTHQVEARVFSLLLQQLQASSSVPGAPPPPCSPDRVTVFQLWTFLKRWKLREERGLRGVITRLTTEEYFLSALRSPKRRRALNKMRGRGLAELLPLSDTLQTLAAMQLDSNHRVCRAAAGCLSRAAGCGAFRRQALVYYTESLKSSDVQIQQGSCMALKCLKATESVDLVSDLWSSRDEDVCSAARETVLSFGKKGYLAFQRMDQLSTEMQEELHQNQETEITFL